MKITKVEHKGLLNLLFIEESSFLVGGEPRIQQKSFPLNKLADAGSAYKKIIDTADHKTGKFKEDQIEFTPSEIAILKELFDAKTDWKVGDAEFVLELKDIFDGKDKKEEKKK